MASFIYSIYDYFGSSISVPGYGFPMNDRGSFFNNGLGQPLVCRRGHLMINAARRDQPT